MTTSKRILVIMPKFFGYEVEIRKELDKLGYMSEIIYENMDEVNLFFRFVYVYFKKLKPAVMNLYYKNRIRKINQDIDTVLVIRGQSLSKKSMNYISQKYDHAKYIMYQWDSIENNKEALEITDYFDYISTFDMEDASEYHWEYRPLFYVRTADRNVKRKYEVSFIGSLHSKRIKIVNRIHEIANINHLNSFTYLFTKKGHYIKQKYLVNNAGFLNAQEGDIHFKALSIDETNDVFSESNIVVDYTHLDQSGFTMRTIESIGNRCKLVTNNKNVKYADFYNKNNVWVYEDDHLNIPKTFLQAKFIELDSDIYEKYSIKSWIQDLLKDNYENK